MIQLRNRNISDIISLIVLTIGIFIFSLVCIVYLNPLHKKNLQSYNQKYQQYLLTCIYCKGSGERVEDTNRTIFMAKTQLYLNKHLMVDKCAKCTKLEHGDGYVYCDEANNQYSIFLREYAAAGPKFEKTMCSECMGCGQFTRQNRDGSYVTQQEYEQEEKEKQGE